MANQKMVKPGKDTDRAFKLRRVRRKFSSTRKSTEVVCSLLRAHGVTA